LSIYAGSYDKLAITLCDTHAPIIYIKTLLVSKKSKMIAEVTGAALEGSCIALQRNIPEGTERYSKGLRLG
jgi:hypothetical protein